MKKDEFDINSKIQEVDSKVDESHVVDSAMIYPTKDSINEVKKGSKLTTKMTFNVMELMGHCMMHNQRRAETIDLAIDYLEQKDIMIGVDYEEDTLLKVYRNTRRQIFKVKIEELEVEKKKYTENIMRLARKAEAANDFRTAKECYKEVASILGVFKEKDDSKIILNFVKAIKSE